MSTRLSYRVRALAAALAVGLLPILLGEYVLSQHASARGRAEAEAMAAGLLARAEAVVGEGIALLRELAAGGHASCQAEHSTVLAASAFASAIVRQIGVADETGAVLCAEPESPFSDPVRVPAANPDDPEIVIGILPGAAGNEAVLVNRAQEGLRLVVRLFDAGIAGIGGDGFAAAADMRVTLEDGSEWYSIAAPEPDGTDGAITRSRASKRLPIVASVSIPAAAVEASVRSLRILVLVGGVAASLAVLGTALWATWSRGQTADAFARALRLGQFVPYYQPVIDISEARLAGCEVLVRWRREDGTIVSPGAFMPFAEQSGHVFEITRSLMRAVVADLEDLCRDRPDLKISINLFAGHFDDMGIVDDLRAIFAGRGIGFGQLVMEVTERMPLKDLGRARQVVDALHALGVRVALDDVGTGHGGLAHLQRLGVDVIKIDKMFVDQIGTEGSGAAIVQTLVDLARWLGLGIVAEGVETDEQVRHLRTLGVAHAQGYLFAPALPARAFRDLVLAARPLARLATEEEAAARVA